MERQFKGIWIPAEIWLNKNLSAIDKILLADIDSFTGNGKLFYKSNATLSRELGVSESTVKRAFKTLLEQNLIRVSGGTRKRLCEALNSSYQGHSDSYSGHSEPSQGQNEPSVGSKCPPTNKETNQSTNQLDYPFEDSRFKDAWREWIEERKAKRIRKYTPKGEQGALHLLQKESNNDCETAIKMIHNAIARGWQGIYPLKNDKRNTKKGFDSSEYSSYIESLS